MSPLRITFFSFLFFLGFLFFLNGLLHAFFYIMGDAPLLTGLRLINWLSLIGGSALCVYSYHQLAKPYPIDSYTQETPLF